MPRFKWPGREEKKDPRPDLLDDFIYDEPEDASPEDSSSSDTPEEALNKLRQDLPKEDSSDAAEAFLRRTSRKKRNSEPAYSSPEPDPDQADLEKKNSRPKKSDRSEHRHPVLRIILRIAITLVLLACAVSFIFHRILPDVPILGMPENLISRIVAPAQGFFSGITDAVADFFWSRKLRDNIEAEYNALRAENEQLVYKAMLAEELQNTLSQYEDLSDEIAANANMKPIVCRVIGKSDSNYFSTFTINKGLSDGVENYMAVTISGALVGYTESVRSNEATVRTIIDSEASIAGLIQSSRDQGTVRGTLGIDGTPMCRMYYLPDDNLPRPGDTVVTSGVGMSFPKGIPIGTVRESTRGMDSNKQYIVLEPQADFQHLEYVIVLRYRPVAEAIAGRENGRTNVELVPLESARPSPVVPQIASSLFESQATEDPDATTTPSPEPTDTPEPTPTPSPVPTPTPEYHNFEYQVVQRRSEPTMTPTPSPAPTPTPYVPPDPVQLTYEEDE